VTLVDAHCHVSPIWYEPVETLLFQMDRNSVAQAVLIQLLGQYDNGYQQNCLRRYPGRFASVVAIDATRPDAGRELAALVAAGASGVRLRPDTRSPGPDPLSIWRTAEAEQLAVSCVGTSETLSAPAFIELVAAVPELPIVIEHLGGRSLPDADEAEAAWRLRVLDLADFPNVYLKVPGLGELAPRAPRLPAEGLPLDARPAVLGAALERFGPHRLLWGSDFPPVATREGYANALGWVREALGDLPPEAQAAVFGGTAQRVFKLPKM
jgi:L-fuconolactonase